MTCDFPMFLHTWNIIQNQDTPDIHIKIAEWMEREVTIQTRPRLLLMAFRSFGKSTLVGLFCAWILLHKPNTRILVLSADLALARKMVRNVKRIIERHPDTAHLKPSVKDQWGNEQFTVNRDKELRDPSMLAKGITANITGTRADIIICDDVEVPNTSGTPEKRESLRERLLELDYILTPEGAQFYVGTPHHWHTIYADTPRGELGEDGIFLDGFTRMTVPVRDKDGVIAWPEKYTPESLDAQMKKTGPAHFKSQMLCEPSRPDDIRLDASLLQFYEDDIVERSVQRESVYTLNGKTIKGAMAYWDPSFAAVGNDLSVVAIVYADTDGLYYLHDLRVIKNNGNKGEVDSATQQCRDVIATMQDHKVPFIGIETNGLGKVFPDIMRRELGFARLGCNTKLIHNSKPKATRILEAFDAALAARALFVHRRVLKTPFIREMENWSPDSQNNHDDCLDAVAGAMAMQPMRLGPLFTGPMRVVIGRPPSGATSSSSAFDV